MTLPATLGPRFSPGPMAWVYRLGAVSAVLLPSCPIELSLASSGPEAPGRACRQQQHARRKD
eukprot:7298167-Alexandrium_andersonii.AAC.1